MAKVWVFAEVASDGTPHPSALELLTKARDLGDPAEAVALGPGSTAAAPTLGQYGATTVYASDDPVFADALAQPAAHALTGLVAEHLPDLILFPMSYDGRDIAGRLQAKTGSTLMSNVTDIPTPDAAQTQIFGATKIVDVALEGPEPRILLVRPKSFEASPAGGSAEVVTVDADVPEEERRARRIERHEEESEGPKLEEAAVVVSGGRGLQDPKNFDLLRDLASAVGNAAVGATRAVVDAGWVPYSMQVGQTGTTVKPEVYIAVGISGATQHLVGMKESKRIVAINKDPDAPIFKMADLGIVGDALQIVPKITAAVTSAKG